MKNRGPDQVPSTEIEIQWPYEAPSGKHLLYLIDVKVRGSFNSMKRKTRCKGLGSFSRFYIKTRYLEDSRQVKILKKTTTLLNLQNMFRQKLLSSSVDRFTKR